MRHELAVTVGRIIARRRSILGITQEQLSSAIDVDPMTISRFERGLTLPSLLTIQRLSLAFGITLNDFFDEDFVVSEYDGDALALRAMLGSLGKDEREFILDTVKRFCALSDRKRT